MPLFIDGFGTNASREKVYIQLYKVITELCCYLNIKEWISECLVFDSGISQWGNFLINKGGIIKNTTVDLFTDLSSPVETIFSNFGTHLRKRIRRAEKLWHTEVIDKHCDCRTIDNHFEAFEQLHYEVAGRKTRNELTWQIQREGLKEEDDFLVCIYSNDNELVGACLFSATKYFCNSSVGAYRRELFNEPVSHIARWVAIKYMKSKGIQWFYGGRRYYAHEIDVPTQKEVTISEFKEGFATNFFTKMYITTNIVD